MRWFKKRLSWMSRSRRSRSVRQSFSPLRARCSSTSDCGCGSEGGFPFTVPVELANGTAGYIPTEEALGPHGGGYETRLTSYSNLVPSAGRQIVEAAVRLAGSLEPGAVPHPPKASPVSADGDGIGAKPWSYGNVPPELK